MDVVGVILGWIVTLGCIFAAYLGVQEVQQALVRRPFSPLLTLVLVFGGAGVLFMAVDNFSGYLMQVAYSQYYYSNVWPSIIEWALVIGAGVVIRRDVLLRIQQGSCPQCNTPLMGHSACPACGWGSIRLPLGLATLVQRPTGPVRPASDQAPTVRALSSTPPAAPAPAPAAESGKFCMMCGAALTPEQTFCGKCGAPVQASS